MSERVGPECAGARERGRDAPGARIDSPGPPKTRHASHIATDVWKRSRACTVGSAASLRTVASATSCQRRADVCEASVLVEGVGIGVAAPISEPGSAAAVVALVASTADVVVVAVVVVVVVVVLVEVGSGAGAGAGIGACAPAVAKSAIAQSSSGREELIGAATSSDCAC